MSLTSTLARKDIKELFKNKLGNVKNLFQTEDGSEAFPKKIEMKVEPPEGMHSSSLGNVGTAYDFWFRSFLQRENKLEQQEHEFDIVYAALEWLKEDGILDLKEWYQVWRSAKKTEEMREDYAKGKEVNMDYFLKGLLRITYCQNYFRARNYPRKQGYKKVDENELKDLKNLIEYTSKNKLDFMQFKQIESAKFNPTFSKGSVLVGGADADLIVDDALIDFKTTKDFGYKAEQYNQIIGYYLLDRYQNDGESKLERVGLYFSRQNKYVFIEIKELKEKTKIDELYDELFELLEKEKE